LLKAGQWLASRAAIITEANMGRASWKPIGVSWAFFRRERSRAHATGSKGRSTLPEGEPVPAAGAEPVQEQLPAQESGDADAATAGAA
jgi:hypothetical protein